MLCRRHFLQAGLPVSFYSFRLICGDVWLTAADGFSALFWLYLNKGRFFSTPMKTALTILNFVIMGVACCIVSPCWTF